MDACMLHHGDFAFGETVVAPRRREVRHRGIRVDIGDRAFDLLLLLAESHGCVLSKQQIVARVWHDRVVEGNAVEALDFQLLGMWGRWMCHYLNGEYAQAIPLAHHFNELASTSSRKCDHLAALRLSGMSRLFAGDLPGALADLQRAANDTEPLPRAQRMRFLYDEKMLSHASLALTLWFMGETELARQAAQQSLDDAREFDHPVSICYALSEAVCTLALLRDDAAALEEAVSSLAAETRRHSISTWYARAQMWEGLLDLRAGDTTVFARTISPAMTSIGSKRFYVSLSPYVTALAEALCRRGMISEAAEVIDASVARATRTDEKCALPELWRAKAEVLVASDGDEAIPAAE